MQTVTTATENVKRQQGRETGGYCTSGISRSCAGAAARRRSGEPLGDPPGSSLGILTKSCDRPSEHRLEKWAMQSAARQILPTERTANCLRSISRFKGPNAINGTNYYDLGYFRKVEVVKSKDSFHYGNLMTCGSVWHCPICAGKVSEHRRSELVQAVEYWKSQGADVLLLTLTVPHYSHQKLQVVLNGLTDALRKMTYSKGWRSLSKSIGLHGRIRALEVTYGENGWHPHFHLLLFTYRQNDLVKLQSEILGLWKSSCLKASLPEPNHHGVKVDNGTLAAQYVGKWGIEHEMTKGHIKKSNAGYSPFDLLRVYLGNSPSGRFHEADPDRAAALFRDYAKAFKGRRQLVWSQGLRDDLLSCAPEITDEEIADHVDQDAELFALIPIQVWKVILGRNLRGQVLEKCREGKDSLDEYLKSLDQKNG